MAKAKKTTSTRRTTTGKKSATKAIGKQPSARRARPKAAASPASATAGGPVTLAEARALAQAQAPQRTVRRSAAPAVRTATHASVADERQKLEEQISAENERRIREYKATISIMKSRGVKGLAPAAEAHPRRRGSGARRATVTDLCRGRFLVRLSSPLLRRWHRASTREPAGYPDSQSRQGRR